MRIDESQKALFNWVIERTPPSTRYQGSKLKLLDWIWDNIADISFNSALDVFGGTGCVSYLFKSKGKSVTYNDYLRFNQIIATAIIENSKDQLNENDIEFILRIDPDFNYATFITETYGNVFFTDEENKWIDTVAQNIPELEGKYKQALAYYALFQSCIIKRPYNLFHRKNLYMRTADVCRTFGNKATWDTPFETHFRNFVVEANASVFNSKNKCKSLCFDALEVPGKYDLVYIDPPYINSKGTGIDYLDFYNFLEGLVDYQNWEKRINLKKKHRPLDGKRSPWSETSKIRKLFRDLFHRYRDSILVVSYRSDGIPSEEELVKFMREFKSDVKCVHYGEYKYVLSTNGNSKELLIIGQ